MKICVLNDPSWENPFNPEIYLKSHKCEKQDVFYKSSFKTLKEISNKFDVFLNFCDASIVEKRPGLDVIFNLEKLKLPFTGSYSFGYEPSRNKMKNICNKKNILMPKAICVGNIERLTEEIVSDMTWPLIVKHSNSFGSVGLIKESKVYNFKDLLTQTERMLKLSKAVRIEEFIEGKEFSCLVSQNPNNINDPIAYVPIEIEFPEGECFKHNNLKWIDYKKMNCKQVKDENLSFKIQDMTKKLFKGINGRGYGRCDIRMDKNENLYMLEINSQAGILLPPDEPSTADIILQLDSRGHETFMDLLLKSALVNPALINHRD